MGYRFEADESVPKGVRRIVHEEIRQATEYLGGRKEGGPDEAIHEARKGIKKIRAVMRLVRSELGPAYGAENDRLRSIAADLSQIRDAAAIIESFDQLPGAGDFASVRNALVERKKQTDVARDRDGVIQEAALGLRRLDRRVKTWPLKTTGFAAIAPGLEDRYRRGRKAMKTAREEGTPESFHEWRKRVKDHWYHVRLIENLWTDEMQAREKSLKELETWLGDDHNLSVLRELIADAPAAFGEAAVTEAALDAIDERRKELRRNSLSLGPRLYQEKPKAFTRRLRKLWDDWQSRPKRLAKQESGMRRKPAAKVSGHSRRRSRVA